MTLSEELLARNFIGDSTFEDLSELDQPDRQLTVYVGFDASAPSQTIGNLIPLLLVKTFLRHGHKAIVLAGGATSLVGDPGGKLAERQLPDKKFIENNVAIAKKQIQNILRSIDSDQWRLVNNLDWWIDFRVLDFLREVGKYYSVGQLIKRDFVAQRLGEDNQGISHAEFSYGLIQGYDFLYLFEKYGCTIQVGGSDQWGNCLSGVDLIRRKKNQRVEALTVPLMINKSTGRKFGKSEGGAVWLSAELTSPFDFYQFWLNSSDDDLADHLLTFTEISPAEIGEIVKQHQKDPSQRLGQIKLAKLVTRLVHGQSNLDMVEFVNSLVFAKSGSSVPSADVSLDSLTNYLPIVDTTTSSDIVAILVDYLKLASSRREARQFIDEGAINLVDLNGLKEIGSDGVDFSSTNPFIIDKNKIVFIRRGRNKIGMIRQQ